ncbi:WD-40 repeat protein [Reticulomyxa filosa]|uniref:WD-40 repeat protein n=1 Tax=Reticulomyxa filosa TaxID=46433 RepID=X6PDE8_RETFI|nr:WD-40 repeat protein [Reticulomyxa filosa]|eukprot:ETO36133.1 WD-40 repeat protein [Reticulomyxa filosa]
MFDTFRSSSKLINTFTGHTRAVHSIDYSTFNDCQFICSGSGDNTVRVWDVDNSKQIQSFNVYPNYVRCVKFSSYHYHNNRQHVVCSSSDDTIILFWDFKHNKQLKIFNGHIDGVCGIEFSKFNGEQFVYGMLKHQNHYMFSMDMKVLFGVLIFHHYKTITKMIIIK